MSEAKVSWRESLVVGFLVFGLIGTASVLGLLIGFVTYIRTDTSISEMLNPSIVASTASPRRSSGL